MKMKGFPQNTSLCQVEAISEENIHTIPSWVAMDKRTRYYLVYCVDEDTTVPQRLLFQEECLPEWVRYHMKVLDSAGLGILVKEVGRKVGNTYWLGKNLT